MSASLHGSLRPIFDGYNSTSINRIMYVYNFKPILFELLTIFSRIHLNIIGSLCASRCQDSYPSDELPSLSLSTNVDNASATFSFPSAL